MKPQTVLLLVLAVLTLARVWWVLDAGISEANARLFVSGQHPAAAFFEGPGGAPATVRTLGALGGGWWMATGALWAALACLACARLAAHLGCSARAACLAGLGLNCVPAFHSAAFVAGSALPALTLALVGTTAAWDGSRRQYGGLWPWVLAALTFGAAALYAYEAAATGLAVALLCLARGAAPRSSRVVGSTLVLASLAAALTGPLLWNLSHDWLPFAAWTPRALVQLDAPDILTGVGAYLLAASPLLGVLLPWTVTRAQASERLFLLTAAAPGWLLVALCIYRGWQPHDTLLLPVALFLPLAARAWENCGGRLVPVLAVAAVGLLFSVPMWQAARPGPGVGETAQHVLALDERLSPELQGGIFFIAGEPGLAATLDYHLREAIIPVEGHPRVYLRECQAASSQYALWPSYDQFEAVPGDIGGDAAQNPFVGHTAIYVGRESPADLPQSISGAFSEVQLVREVGEANARLYIYLCLDYQTMPL